MLIEYVLHMMQVTRSPITKASPDHYVYTSEGVRNRKTHTMN